MASSSRATIFVAIVLGVLCTSGLAVDSDSVVEDECPLVNEECSLSLRQLRGELRVAEVQSHFEEDKGEGLSSWSCPEGYERVPGAIGSTPHCPGTAYERGCVLKFNALVSYCDQDDDCDGFAFTSNGYWNSVWPGSGQGVQRPFWPAAEWTICAKKTCDTEGSYLSGSSCQSCSGQTRRRRARTCTPCPPHQLPKSGKDACCALDSVEGWWQALGSILGKVTHSITTGTEKTQMSANGRDYSNTISTSIGTTVEPTFLGSKLGSIQVSAEFTHQWSRSYRSSLSTTKTEQSTYTIEVGAERAQGRQLWQFQFVAKDGCSRVTTTWTNEFALTRNPAEEPCCFPGHCTDYPYISCNWCTPGFKRLNDARCKEGYPLSPSSAAVAAP